MSPASRTSAYLLILTAVLVAVGCILYVQGAVGLAQFLLVLASGTAGAGIVLFLESR